jgi:hypothetical protein
MKSTRSAWKKSRIQAEMEALQRSQSPAPDLASKMNQVARLSGFADSKPWRTPITL